MNSNVSSSGSSSVPVETLPLDQAVPMWISGLRDEDLCPCGAVLKASEKKKGLCRKCEQEELNPKPVESAALLFQPLYQLPFAPVPPSSLIMLTSISPQFVPQMAKKRCPNGDGDKLKESSFPRGWKCSNKKCAYHRYG